VGEAGAGMANVAFCDPGTRILEIQPETFFDGWTRGTCLIMALQWNAYFAKCHSSDDGALHFSVDIGMLRNAIEQICGP
jgi:capsular polysaccharide biosynthesis protein